MGRYGPNTFPGIRRYARVGKGWSRIATPGNFGSIAFVVDFFLFEMCFAAGFCGAGPKERRTDKQRTTPAPTKTTKLAEHLAEERAL